MAPLIPARNPGKSYAFGWKAFKRYPEIIPMVAILTFAVVGTISFGLYSLTKTDVIINRKKELPPWERVDLLNPKVNKLIVVNQKVEPNHELIAVKKAMQEKSV